MAQSTRRQTERCHLRGCCQQGSPYFCCARHEQLAEDRREWPRCDERNADVVPGNSILVHQHQTPLTFHDPSEILCTATTSTLLARLRGIQSFDLNFLGAGCTEHERLRKNFVLNWKQKHPVKGVSVVSVIKITMPREVQNRHQMYKTTKVMPTNVLRRFHGTSRFKGCRFHVGGALCLRQDCAFCSICRVGFKIGDNVGHSPKKKARLRYGRGIYFTSLSGKANQFANQTAEVCASPPGAPTKKVRFMLVADVVAGKSFETHEIDFQGWTSPPSGYDSVIGKVGPELKDELVVYKEAAALPTHIISYRC